MKLTDTYTLQARFLPVVIVVLPVVAVLGGAVFSGHRPQIAAGTALTVFSVIASQLGRDRGRRLEPELWRSWGGSPTLQRMRFRSERPSQLTDRLHARIAVLLGDSLPSETDEREDPEAADARYNDAVARVRGLTRDRSQFALLLSENTNYGFRRNVLGLKLTGIMVDVLSLAGCALLIALTDGSLGHRLALYAPGAAISLLLLAFWLVAVSRDWVRIPAGAYSDRLFEAVDVLARDSMANQNTSNVETSA